MDQDLGMNQDWVRLRSPNEDERMDQDLGRNHDWVRRRSPNEDERMDHELGMNQDWVRLRSPNEDERMDQDHNQNTFLEKKHHPPFPQKPTSLHFLFNIKKIILHVCR